MEETFPGKVRQDAFSENPQQDIGNSRETRLHQGQALRVCAVRTALTEPSLHAHPESGKGDGAADAHPLTSGGAQVLGLIIKELPTNSADEAGFSRSCSPLRNIKQ